MSDILDLVDKETRRRYLQRASEDGFAVLPDLKARKSRKRASKSDTEDVSSADAHAENDPEPAGDATSENVGEEKHDDKAPLLNPESDRDSNSESDAGEEDDDAASDARSSLGSMDRKSTSSAVPMSKRMRVAYWSCFSVVFGAGIACIVLLVLASPSCDQNKSANQTALAWWQRTVIYQVYPRSLQDSDNDGIGDLLGIANRVDYIYSLGVRTIWLSPIFESPMVDFGYDISNYTNIAPIFGTLEDFDRLLDAIHARGMQLLLDFVPNHTSDKHPWFVESRSSRSNSKRNWYVWRNGTGPDNAPPNNWQSVFGGSAWQYDNISGQYYLHQFTREQPDLNFENPEVIAAMSEVLRFWLRRGVDGFRVDAIGFLLEDAALRNETCTVNGTTSFVCTDYNTMNHTRTFAQPGFHAIVRGFRETLDQFSNASQPRFMVGEMYSPQLSDVIELYGNSTAPECHFPFNFLLLGLQRTDWTGVTLSQTIAQWLNATTSDQWPNWVLGNHDNNRVASRLGSVLARTANFLLLLLPGTPTTYYGEEIGMVDGNVTWNETVDPSALNTGDLSRSRDPERTPMQWNSSENTGFSAPGVRTWLPVASTYATLNVAVQESSPESMLSLYRDLTRLRSNELALQHSQYRLVTATPSLFAFAREYNATGTSQYLVALNVGSTSVTANFTSGSALSAYQPRGVVVLSALQTIAVNASVNLTSVELSSGEALLVRLESL